MKKKLGFMVLVVALALALVLPAAPAAAATETVTLEPTWQKTTNYLVEPNLGVTAKYCTHGDWSWTSTVWDGGQYNGYGAGPISGWVANDFWAYWDHEGTNTTQYTHRWLKTTVDIGDASLLTGVKLVSKYKSGNLTINDDLFVYVNDVMVASGGTAPKVGKTVPAGFVTASGQDKTNFSETDGWYIAGGLSIPVGAFHNDTNNICILLEEFADWGGIGHLLLEVTREVPHIEKTMASDGYLGDIITVTLDVENPYTSATVKDIIPDGLRYIPGTFMVDSGSGPVAVTPNIVDNTISTPVGQGDFIITFDVQVVEVQCEDVDVTNTAELWYEGEKVAEYDADITLHPYEGFEKVIDDWTSPTFSPCIVPMGTDVHWWVDINFTNTLGRAITDVVVQDRLGGDLELHHVDGDPVGTPTKKKDSWTNSAAPPDVTVDWTGETNKVHLTWRVGDLGIVGSDTLTLDISPDINPGTGHGKKAGQQEYTSPGWHDLNSGAVIKFTDSEYPYFQLSAHTCPLKVYAAEEWLILNNKDTTTWQPIADGKWGLLAYNSAGDEFEYAFCSYNLEHETTYRIIYYADYQNRYVDWGGDNPGALIFTVTTDDTGYVCTSGSVDLGMDLPDEDDYNYNYHDYSGDPDYYANAHGAKIWLVPSDCYNVGAKKVDTWSPTRFYFETDLIWYDDTDD